MKIFRKLRSKRRKPEIDYVVKQECSNAMEVIGRYTDRLQMLLENPTVNKENFIIIETDSEFQRYNEIDGREMKWIFPE